MSKSYTVPVPLTRKLLLEVPKGTSILADVRLVDANTPVIFVTEPEPEQGNDPKVISLMVAAYKVTDGGIPGHHHFNSPNLLGFTYDVQEKSLYAVFLEEPEEITETILVDNSGIRTV